MTSIVNLSSKDVKEIIAKFLGVKVEDVIPNKYTFGVSGISIEQIQAKMMAKDGD